MVAAGNDGANAANYSPAGFNNVITVSALNPNNTFAFYSNYGSVVDLIAPGTNVESLWKNGGYNTTSGTTMASPHVAGAAALFCSSNAGATFNTVRSGLIAAGEAGSWAGDPDGISEPLVDAQSL
ncbi:S8 family serine peptidase [bacterium]|nr:S8 family serine peptidase [bacterium]